MRNIHCFRFKKKKKSFCCHVLLQNLWVTHVRDTRASVELRYKQYILYMGTVYTAVLCLLNSVLFV